MEESTKSSNKLFFSAASMTLLKTESIPYSDITGQNKYRDNTAFK